MASKQFVIDKTTKKVLRFGFCDFANDGSFTSGTEEIIENNGILLPPLEEQDWYWNQNLGEFQKTQP